MEGFTLDFKLPRMWHWILIALFLLGTIAALSPQQLPVVAYKVCMVSLFGVLGYWVDRSLFPYARPHEFRPDGMNDYGKAFEASMIRRALIILAVVLAGALGL